MVNYGAFPEQRITVTHGGSNYQLEGLSVHTEVILTENASAQAVLRAANTNGEVYLNQVDINDNVKIEYRLRDVSTTWKQVFGGWTFDLFPHMSMEQGLLCGIAARGYDVGLLAMPVCQEYGSESVNSSLNTIKEVLTDSNVGIIPKFCQKILASATDSGYSFNTTKVADVTSDFRYLYFPYKPALKCLEDMLDLIGAANAPSSGVHWIVIPDGTTAYLCLATIGAHEDLLSEIWPTWWNIDETNSTLEQGKDFTVTDFNKQDFESNYILYHGKFMKPADGDRWTELTPFGTYWGTGDCSLATASGVDYHKVGSYAIDAEPSTGLTGYWWYPTGASAGWNLSNVGGKYNIPTMSFYIRITQNIEAPLEVQLWTSSGNYFTHNLVEDLGEWCVTHEVYELVTSSYDQFFSITIPVGPYFKKDWRDRSWVKTGSADWTNINSIKFRAKSKSGVTGHVYLDGLHFSGWVLRGARDDTKIASQRCRIKVITDDVAKDDSTVAATDTYVMGQLAKAELYRAIQTPLIGDVTIPLQPSILPGQFAHIHADKKAAIFNIDKNMRIVTVHHIINSEQGYLTRLSLTDDLTNSRPMPHDRYNLLLKAVSPDYQTRERASQKAREIDISQTVLSKNYST